MNAESAVCPDCSREISRKKKCTQCRKDLWTGILMIVCVIVLLAAGVKKCQSFFADDKAPPLSPSKMPVKSATDDRFDRWKKSDERRIYNDLVVICVQWGGTFSDCKERMSRESGIYPPK
jgi:hypothetical protein